MTAIAIPRPWPRPGRGKWWLGGVLGLFGVFSILSSNVFEIEVIDQPELRAFPGCEGFGCETTHGRDGYVYIINSTADSGAGTLRGCMTATGPRICVFNITGDGTITLNSLIKITDASNQGNLAIFGQTGNIQIRNGGSFIAIAMGDYNSQIALSDVLIQHIRMRAAPPNYQLDLTQLDNLNIWGPSTNIVLDHMEFLWSGDEPLTFWRGPRNITVSNSIIGQGIVKTRSPQGCPNVPCQQNVGPLHGGGSGTYPQWDITYTNNLFLNLWYRVPGFYTSTGTNGVLEVKNNVFYNVDGSGTQLNAQDMDQNTIQNLDFANNYHKIGPFGRWPLIITNNFQRFSCTKADASVSGSYCKNGDMFTNATDPTCPAGVGPDPNGMVFHGNAYYNANMCAEGSSLYYFGNTYRNQNGTVYSAAGEANNYDDAWIDFLKGEIPSGGSDVNRYPYPFVRRATVHTSVPVHPVVLDTATQAYTNIVINGDVGALPHDSVTAALVADPDNGGEWVSSEIPSPWGTGTYPVLNNTGWADRDNDGLPDDEEANYNSDPDVPENHAVEDHDLDGYKNIEEWAHSLVP